MNSCTHLFERPFNRRRLLRTTGACLLLGCALPHAGSAIATARTAGEQASGGDWLVAQGNPARTGFAASAGPVGDPTLRWCWSTQAPGLTGSPVIADGVLYATIGVMGVSTLIAIDVDDATLLWTQELDFQPFASAPAVSDGMLYLGGIQGEVAAIDLDQQTTVWQTKLEAGTSCSPLVVDDMLYIGDDNDTVSAIDIEDGSVRWRFVVGPGSSYTIGPSPAYAGGTIFFGSATGKSDTGLFAINAKDGSEIWHFSPRKPGLFTPAIAEGVVYAGGSGGTLYAIDAERGKQRWTQKTGEIWTSPAITGSELVVQTFDGRLLSLDLDKGEARWEVESPGAWASPVVAGETIYVGATGLRFETGLHAFDLATGKERWRAALDGVTTSVAVAGDTVFATAQDGAICAFGGMRGNAAKRGQGGDGAFVGPIAFSREVDANTRPIDPTENFDADTDQLQASFDVVGIASGATWQAVWSRDDEELATREITWGGLSAGRVSERISANQGSLATGDYTIELRIDGTPIRSATATIA